MKIIFDFFISYWDKVIPIIISIIALLLSVATWIAQRNFSKRYSKQTNIVISNSILLALYDINLLIHKVEHVDGISFDKDQLTFQLESLRSNLKLVNSMKLDQLPSYSMLNFQTYLKDLREVLYKLESDVRKFDYELEKCNDKEKVRKYWRKVLLNSLIITREQLQQDKQCIEEKKDIFEKKYRKVFNSMDDEATRIATDNNNGDPLKYVKHK
ncbi:hypothetical protein PSQ53_10520 [Limosilactobacillus reuteri]|uniref:Uncharacterized protein n=1 Tax=Limosilactobacillus reuteri TaxID=1598 RepID=A0AAW6JFX9_LIMRT|nr:hypothetical protein [Limosilactobacillus reuteri]MDD1383338.1 hypothetical protein [Limosilactobacillus reuteri]MDD1399065.1 hypothetical protein [Limosilactobacillus reuteri]MDD1404777.1 hypothetical protein [Limosilactobacillus reuteri]